jgi:hypothetical protein
LATSVLRFDSASASARVRLLQVDAAADTGLEARLDLQRRVLVLHVVVFGQLHQPAKALHVVVGARRLERGLLGRVQQLEVARQLVVADTIDVALRAQAVPQQLREAQRRAAAVNDCDSGRAR